MQPHTLHRFNSYDINLIVKGTRTNRSNKKCVFVTRHIYLNYRNFCLLALDYWNPVITISCTVHCFISNILILLKVSGSLYAPQMSMASLGSN